MTEMTSGIGDLLQRLRQDGVEAGEAEKQRLLRDAEEQAAALLADAKAKAKEIVAAADAEAVAKRKQLDAELGMAARDFALRFAERVKSQAIEPLVRAQVDVGLDDPNLLKEVLSGLIREKAGDASVTVSPEIQQKLGAYFERELAGQLVDGQLEIKLETGLTGFRLQRKGESFSWDVTGEAVADELSQLVEPSLRKYFQLNSTSR